MTATMGDFDHLPPLPDYTLELLPSLVPPIPDKLLTLLLPIAAYWGASMFFHWIDEKDFFPQYRLHTPAEVAKRNRVSRWEVVRDVVIQQIIQTAVGWLLGMTEPDDFFGKEEYDIAVWARRIRIAQSFIPGALALVGLDAKGLSGNIGSRYPVLSQILLGGQHESLSGIRNVGGPVKAVAPNFATWELTLAWAIYWLLIPALQFAVAIVVVDTWQYFLHRAMHMNKWLYSKLLGLCQSISFTNHHCSYLPFASPPIVRPLRIRGPLQSPIRRLPTRYPRRQHRLQSCRLQHATRNGFLHRLHHQNRGRPLWLRSPLGPTPAHHLQQRRLSRRPPPKLGHQNQFLATVFHILGPYPRHSLDGRRRISAL